MSSSRELAVTVASLSTLTQSSPPTKLSQIPLLSASALDSLAYLDNEAEVRQLRPAVEALIMEEARRGTRAESVYTALLPASTKAVATGVLSPLLAMSDRAPSCEPPILPLAPRDVDTLESWHNAVQKINAVVDHAGVSLGNFALLDRYGPTVWKVQNSCLESAIVCAKNQLCDVKKETAALNGRRKSEQLKAATRLGKLGIEYRAVQARNRAIVTALSRHKNKQDK